MTPAAQHAPLVRVVLVGVTGRMGGALLRAAPAFPQLVVTGAIASAASLALGRDAGEVGGLGVMNLTVSSDLPAALAQGDVALDFSHASAAAASLAACRTARKPLLIGTSGLPEALEPQIAAAAREIPLLIAANTSLGAALLTELTRAAAQALPLSFDVDVLDLHHRQKADAPSGTALALGRAAAEGRGVPLEAFLPGTSGASPGRAEGRPPGAIGFAAVRAGDLIGEHTVLFTGPGEALSLTHRASDRAVFAHGALAGALWLRSQPPGRYAMCDFLGFKTAT